MKTESDLNAESAGAALGSAFREHIVRRLGEALEIAAQRLPRETRRFRELLEESIARAAGAELALGAGAGPALRLSCAAFSNSGGDPVTEFLLIPFGEVRLERPVAGGNFVFTRKHAESAKRWFDQLGRRLAIDYEHQSFERYNRRPDGLRPAAGWIGGLELREDGLWATDVTWTQRARELLRSGEYRYFSPVIYWTDEDYSDVAALGPVALTNDPAMRSVQALAASRGAGSAAAGPAERPADWPAPDGPAEFAPRAELEAAEREVALLRKQLAAQEADTFVERGMRLGKILDSTSMDWREDYLLDPERAEQRLARAPVLLPPGRVLALDRNGAVEPLARARGEFRRHAEAYKRWGIAPEDLEAYEQAVAEGRVRRYGVSR